jgi:hypothetical protein
VRFERPRPYAAFSFSVDFLDEDVGEVYTYQVSGEYPIHRRFSLGTRIPFYSVREEFLPSNDKIGDVGLLMRGVLWGSESQTLLVGQDVTFPTGSDTESLGAGVVTFNPYLSYLKTFGFIDLYGQSGIVVEAASAINPTLIYQVGLSFSIVRKGLPVDFLLAFQGVSYLASDMFNDGSTKGYLLPGFILKFTKQLEGTFLGKISILDTLKLKPGLSTDDIGVSLLSDVEAGFGFNINYEF